MSADKPILPPEARARLLAVRDTLAAKHCAEQSGQTWRDMSPGVRQVVVMLALDVQRADEAHTALRPWASFTDEERNKLGATARFLQRDLQGAGVLR